MAGTENVEGTGVLEDPDGGLRGEDCCRAQSSRWAVSMKKNKTVITRGSWDVKQLSYGV